MTDHQRNLELKVRCSAEDLVSIRRRVAALICTPVQHLHQVDTYFQVMRGRLKLREIRTPGEPGAVARAELIAYARPSDPGSRWSTYEVVPIVSQAAANLLAGLLMTHEQLARVEKVREIAIVGHTRIHIDDVSGLGAFVELETVISTQGDTAAATEHRQVIAALGLDRFPTVAGSYGDLIRV